MAEKKVIKKTTKSSGKEEKVSPEEISKMKEEFLARIDAEIGEDSEEVVVDEKKENIKVSEDEKKEDFEKEMLEPEKREEDVEPKEEIEEKEDSSEKEEEKKDIIDERVDSEEEIRDVDEQDRDKREEINSTFSAAEFGLADNKSSRGKNIILFLVVFLLVAIISALFYLFSAGILKIEKPQENVEITPTQSPSPTPTPVEFDRAELSIQILNGSGESGVAASMETFMEDLGYENLEIGNADNSDYENVTIQIKEEYEDLAQLIDEDLASDYTVNSDYEILEDDSEYDVVIIVGSEPDEETANEEADE